MKIQSFFFAFADDMANKQKTKKESIWMSDNDDKSEFDRALRARRSSLDLRSAGISCVQSIEFGNSGRQMSSLLQGDVFTWESYGKAAAMGKEPFRQFAKPI